MRTHVAAEQICRRCAAKPRPLIIRFRDAKAMQRYSRGFPNIALIKKIIVTLRSMWS